MIDFSEYRSILCLNGALPESEFFSTALPIIAADGAANTLVKMGITPQLVIGDLDSIDPELLQQLPVLHYPNQDHCDFEKSLDYLAKQQLLPSIIVGVNGGYLDHILNNVNVFVGTKNILYAPPIIGFALSGNETKEIILPVNTKISMLGMPEAVVSTNGLRWELNRYQLLFPGRNSCFNQSREKLVRIHIERGSMLVLIYEVSCEK